MVNISSNMSPSGTFGAFKPPAPRKKYTLPYLAVIAVVLILGAGYYFFIYQGASFSFVSQTIPPVFPLTSIETKISNLPNFQFGVFDSSVYKSLKSYGALPIVADSLGRVNPFIPY